MDKIMAYNHQNFLRFTSANIIEGKPTQWRYTTTDSLVTTKSSDYFNLDNRDLNLFGLVHVNDLIYIEASDGTDWVKVTSVSNPITVSTGGDIPSLAEGDLAVGDSNNELSSLSGAPSQFVQYNALGNATAVTVTGPVTFNSSAVSSIGMTDGTLLIGNGSNVGTERTISGDAALSNEGVITIGQVLDMTNMLQLETAQSSGHGALVTLYSATISGGGTNDYTVPTKSRVVLAWTQNLSAGGGPNTITVKNGANAITDGISINKSDGVITFCNSIDDAYATIAASGTLRLQSSGGPSAIINVVLVNVV